MKIFLIGPVRNVTPEEEKLIGQYVKNFESLGHQVHWSIRDVNQTDPSGLRICLDNLKSMSDSDEVHVWWNPNSQSSVFDLGMAFALGKKIITINATHFQPTPTKSFTNVLLALEKIRQENAPWNQWPPGMNQEKLQQLLDYLNKN